ncbi:hypothetical protein [Allochromatium vinosum]|uniref:Uncharacterized protein n=1 Tax=Allochromatium vinosum (strain ATCC 17899 / DSM 180 / NBRC 103801 / NCIMB 10441 / D) TaxID=572477 RepID=D3RNZ5_ALLVD|nr:hypothetical protein [Allochromatium vinosum]ADC61505.1 hypothetical protein Alvin_0555 [Allochromatium vinosum DSM 180]
MQHLDVRPSADSLVHLGSDVLRDRLSDLIRRYAHQATADLAEAVVAHIDALYLRPDFRLDPAEQCAYRRFARHWHWLAARHGQGAGRADVCLPA